MCYCIFSLNHVTDIRIRHLTFVYVSFDAVHVEFCLFQFRYKLPVSSQECPRTCPRYDNNKMLAHYLFIGRLAAVARPSVLYFLLLYIKCWLTEQRQVSLSLTREFYQVLVCTSYSNVYSSFFLRYSRWVGLRFWRGSCWYRFVIWRHYSNYPHSR